MLKLMGAFRSFAICMSLLLSAGSALAQQAFTVKVVRTWYDQENDRCCYVILVEKPSSLDANLIRVYVGIEVIDLDPGNIWDGLYYVRGDWTEKYVESFVCVPADGTDRALTVQLNKWSDNGGVYRSDQVSASTIVVNCGGSKCCIEDKKLFKRELVSNDDGTCCTKLTLLKESSCGTGSVGVAGSVSQESTVFSKVGDDIVICDDEAELVFYDDDMPGVGSVCKVALSEIPVSGTTVPSKRDLACCAMAHPRFVIRNNVATVTLGVESGNELPCEFIGLSATLKCKNENDVPIEVFWNGDAIPRQGSSSMTKPVIWIPNPSVSELPVDCLLCVKLKVRSSSCGTPADCGEEVCIPISWVPDPSGFGRWVAGLSYPKQQLDDEDSQDQACQISDVNKDGQLSIVVPVRQPSTVFVYTSLGQLLQTHSLAPSIGTQEIQLPHKGVFLVRIQTASDEAASKVVLYSE